MDEARTTLSRQSLCATCLSQDRKLFPVEDSKSHSLILNLCEGDQLCWECNFFVLKLAAFRSRAARAQALLACALQDPINVIEIKSLSNLKTSPIYLEVSLEKPEISIKTEDIKEECENSFDEYTEDPDTGDVSCDETEEDSFLTVSNECTEAKGDEGDCSEEMGDDDVADAGVKNLLDEELPCNLVTGHDDTPDNSDILQESTCSKNPEQLKLTSCFIKLDRIKDDQLSSTSPVTRGDLNQHVDQQDKQATPDAVRTVAKVVCATCNKKFSSRSDLIKHTRIHTGEKPFSCDVCEKRFSQKNSLTLHLRIHTAEKPFVCDVCHKAFKRRSPLTYHLFACHNIKKPVVPALTYGCDFCGKQFKFQSKYIRHINKHTDEKPFACDKCDKQFKTEISLSAHKKAHSGDLPFCCESCDKRFAKKGTLLSHLRIHTDQKPFSCELCDKMFRQKSILNRHVRLIHTDAKPLCCDVCQMRFKEKSNLVLHMRTHTGEKPYDCGVCPARFANKWNLTCHSRIHEGKKARK